MAFNGKGFNFGTPTTSTSTSGAGMFGGQPASAGGFSFGSPAPLASTQPTQAAGFSLGTQAASSGFGASLGGGTTATQSASAGFSFGATSTPAAPAGFGFGGAVNSTPGTQATTTAPPPFSLGGAKTSAPTGFSLAGQAGTPTGTAGFGLAGQATTAAGTAGFGLAGQASTAAGTPGGFSFGAAPTGTLSAPGTTTQSSGLLSGLLSAPASTAPATTSTGFPLGGGTTLGGLGGTTLGGLGGTTVGGTTLGGLGGTSLGGFGAKTTSTGLTLGAPATSTKMPSTATTTLNTGFGLTAPSATSAGGFGFGASTTKATTAAPGFGFGLSSTTAATSSAAGATTTSAVPSRQMNYKQLEDQINKWMTELEEQERMFLTQATQVNAWDRLLVDNGEKITLLNGDLERVKVDQGKLEQELEFIKAQQHELEELLNPMEKSLEALPTSTDNIDAQLKRMVQDLKEIIDHLNTSASTQDNNDPVLQITKILNAHMDSLHYVESTCGRGITTDGEPKEGSREKLPSCVRLTVSKTRMTCWLLFRKCRTLVRM
ncbi:NUP62-like protein [Mya arenaria]|uniref:NUP62-like protein n=1 Tax=Mya arenaria TaxID=6604 RepID=A0ABY7DY31_MYAAR|nr:NUP62-like protein [Mya arenaria]